MILAKDESPKSFNDPCAVTIHVPGQGKHAEGWHKRHALVMPVMEACGQPT